MSAHARSDFDPFATLVHLRVDGSALPVAWTPDVFRQLSTGDGDRVIGAKHGAEPAGERTFGLRGRRACLVPRGVWHRLILRQPSDLLFITPARGTRHRPVGAGSFGG